MTNSSAAPVAFQTGSILLNELRVRQDKVNKQLQAIDELLSHIKQASPTHQNYVALRNKYPLLDDPEFRRILGISEKISAWKWPSVDVLVRVRNSILDRSNALNTEILRIEKDAKKYAGAAEKRMIYCEN